MTDLTEQDRKALTEFLDGCAHNWVQDGHVAHQKCTLCGQNITQLSDLEAVTMFEMLVAGRGSVGSGKWKCLR